MDEKYSSYANSRLGGKFSEMSSYRFVYPYLKDKCVLDVGCSDGLYLKSLSKESVGIEQIPALAAVCKNSGLNVITGDVLDVVSGLSDNSFEAVLFSHVMEHVDSPIQMLRQIYRIVTPGGILILGLPIERNIYRDILHMDYFNGTHIYSFSVRNAVKLLNEVGFREKLLFFHLPKCRNRVGHAIEGFWNYTKWPFREYFSMAYWIVAEKKR